MIKVPLPVRCHFMKDPGRSLETGTVADFLPFLVISIEAILSNCSKIVDALHLGSCVGGWGSPLFVNVEIEALKRALNLPNSILVQGSFPCDFWLEAETEAEAEAARVEVESERIMIALGVIPLRALPWFGPQTLPPKGV